LELFFYYSDEGGVYTEDGRKISDSLTEKVWTIFEKEERKLDDMVHVPENIDTDTNLASHMTSALGKRLKKFPEKQHADVRALINLVLNFLSVDAGDDLEKMPIGYGGSYKEIDGGNIIIPKGFCSVVNVVLQKLPQNSILFNTEVECIHYGSSQSNPVSVTCKTPSGNHTFQADHVIVTCSLGVLKSSHATMFVPPLPPPKIQSIKAMGFGTVNKIFLQWKTPFWKRGDGAMEFAWKTTNAGNRENEWYRSLYGFDEVLNNENTLLGWIHGDAAEHLENLTDQEVISQCMTLIRQFLGNPSIPNPIAIIRSAWKSNEFARGSYSYISQLSSNADIECLAEPLCVNGAPVVLFAGEATHPHFYSTTHGAMESGVREAKCLENHYKN
jgi:monoamine oxidase